MIHKIDYFNGYTGFQTQIKFGFDEHTKKNLNFEENAEKVLGMWWCTVTDTFILSFASDVLNEPLTGTEIKIPTKRKLL